ncbi:MAG: hypothetical protein KAR20_23590 [Candidatus Heimdallarchaeota archaeon]|nr:hypothetical protein [Candidatus Heimdallarchaeota archaeon]
MIEDLKNGDSTKNSKKSTMEILKSIETGELSAADGISMMNKEDEELDVHIETNSTFLPSQEEIKEIEKWWRIPWIIGLTIFIGTGVAMNNIAMNYGFNFWFFLLILPLIVGVFILALTWPSDDRPWVHVFVNGAGGHRNIVKISIPLPVAFTSWVFKFGLNFTPLYIKEKIDEETIDLLFTELKNGKRTGNPLHVHVDENGSDIVDIYIG